MTVKRESFLTYLALVPVVTGVIIASGVSIFFLVLASYMSAWISTSDDLV
jgi:hypothetical protein